ncbi:MAG: hypothetical protein AAF744_10350 [Pseudomonadota bacterium]
MVLTTMVKLKTIGLANKVIVGAFINGALIGATVVAGAALASRAGGGKGGLCGKGAKGDRASVD